ncbi:MAG: hypothetical protein MZU95_12805 [Desulfomicrobium escambiense]|nr:hypothetical protein [Desulfomicrobium escambiense]
MTGSGNVSRARTTRSDVCSFGVIEKSDAFFLAGEFNPVRQAPKSGDGVYDPGLAASAKARRHDSSHYVFHIMQTRDFNHVQRIFFPTSIGLSKNKSVIAANTFPVEFPRQS